MDPATDLRTIAALFEEHIHLVALADSGINSVADLAGKRVSLDEPGSGTYVDANLILEANGLSADDLTAEALKGNAAADALRNGTVNPTSWLPATPRVPWLSWPLLLTSSSVSYRWRRR